MQAFPPCRWLHDRKASEEKKKEKAKKKKQKRQSEAVAKESELQVGM